MIEIVYYKYDCQSGNSFPERLYRSRRPRAASVASQHNGPKMAEHTVLMSDGAKLQVKILGHASSSKPVLIALHGAPGFSDHTEPEATFGSLADVLRVIVYDARGSGVSDLTTPYTNEQWITDLDEIR